MSKQLPFLNLGCGRVILPAPRPQHYDLIDDITQYALWHNVDRNPEPGVDQTLDIFRYPWPWPDNSFDGALLAHIAEHIPHEIKMSDVALTEPQFDQEGVEAYQRYTDKSLTEAERSIEYGKAMVLFGERRYEKRAIGLANLQDGWYAFFAELHRVLTPGAIIHVLSPYAWSQGGVTDPTHTRLLTEQTFTHSMQPDPNSPFKYATGGLNLEMVEPARFTLTGLVKVDTREEFEYALRTKLNVVYELYVKLRVVK